jgi:hypothetical protein
MKRERLLLGFSVLTLGIFVVLALVYPDFVRESIVVPVLFLVWVLVLLVRAFPQAACLLALVVAGLAIAVASLQRTRKPIWFPSVRSPRAAEQSRYRFWLRRCRQMSRSAFFMDDVSAEMRRLLLSVLAYQEHRTISEVEEMLVQGALDAPPAVRDLTIDRHLAGSEEVASQMGLLTRLWERLSGRAAARRLSAAGAGYQQLEQIILYLEERLEVHRDRDNG